MPDTLRAQHIANGGKTLWQIERLRLDERGRKVWDAVGDPITNDEFWPLKPHLVEVIEPTRPRHVRA